MADEFARFAVEDGPKVGVSGAFGDETGCFFHREGCAGFEAVNGGVGEVFKGGGGVVGLEGADEEAGGVNHGDVTGMGVQGFFRNCSIAVNWVGEYPETAFVILEMKMSRRTAFLTNSFSECKRYL